MKRTLAGITAFVVLVLCSLQFLYPDAPPPADADLRPVVSVVPDADNAYADLVDISAKLQLTKEEREFLNKQEDSDTPDLAAVELLIARNQEVLALFSRFSSRAAFSDPDHRDLAKVSVETPVPQFFPIVFAARLSSLRAAALRKRNRAPEALAEALKIMDAGQMLLRSDQPLIAALVGMLLENIGARRARRVMETAALDKTRLLDAARRLSAYRGGAAALQSGLRFEYLTQSNMLDHLPKYYSQGPSASWYCALAARSRYLYQRERTRTLFAGRFRPLIEEAAKPCLQARLPPHKDLPRTFKPNMFGRLLFSIADPQFEKLYVKRCETDFRVVAVAAAAALAAYRLDKKRYPANLGELVPDYLAAVPADPFTGAALLYSPETGEVHSAGKDADGKTL